MHIMKNSGLFSAKASKMALRFENQMFRKFRVAVESFNARHDIARVHCSSLGTNLKVVVMKTRPAGQSIVNQLIQISCILVEQTQYFH